MRLTIFGIRIEIRRPRVFAVVKHIDRPKPDAEASDHFWSAFQHGGTLVCQCSCGRTVFAPGSDLDWEDGELEDLLAKQTADPEHYVSIDGDDSVAVMDLPGGLLVWGCPCHRAARYEQFLREYQLQILDFYRRINADMAAELADKVEALKNAS